MMIQFLLVVGGAATRWMLLFCSLAPLLLEAAHPLRTSPAMISRRQQQGDAGSSSSTQPDVKQYHLYESVEFHEQIQEWKDQYPDFLRVTTSQDKYGLPAAGEDADCPFYR